MIIWSLNVNPILFSTSNIAFMGALFFVYMLLLTVMVRRSFLVSSNDYPTLLMEEDDPLHGPGIVFNLVLGSAFDYVFKKPVTHSYKFYCVSILKGLIACLFMGKCLDQLAWPNLASRLGEPVGWVLYHLCWLSTCMAYWAFIRSWY